MNKFVQIKGKKILILNYIIQIKKYYIILGVQQLWIILGSSYKNKKQLKQNRKNYQNKYLSQTIQFILTVILFQTLM